MAEKIKEKLPVSRKAKEKIQAAPKEILRRGLLSGTEKLRGQLRDVAEDGRREETEADRAPAAARMGTRLATERLGKLAHRKEKTWSGTLRSSPDASEGTPAPSEPSAPAQQDRGHGEPVRLKIKEAVSEVSPAEHCSPVQRPAAPSSQPVVKTKGNYTQHQAVRPAQGSSRRQEQGRQKLVRETGRKAAARQENIQSRDIRSQTDHTPSTPLSPDRSAIETEGVSAHTEPMKPSRLREHSTGDISVPRFRPGQRDSLPGGKTMRNGKIKDVGKTKAALPGGGTPGRTAKKAVKAADSPRQRARAAERSASAAQQTANAAVQARQRAVQAAGGARRAADAVGKPAVKAAVSALRWAKAAIRAAMAPLSAGGGAVIAIVLVICMVGAIVKSPLGIFFSGGDQGGQRGQTIPAVVREINLEYDAKIETLKTGTYDELSLSGARAPWPQVLAVYAVKTTSDPANEQEVVTMDDTKKALLKQVFWDMVELSSFTSTVPGEGDEEDTTTLYITVTAKTADEMADIYGFSVEQRQQLAEMLSGEYQTLWSAILYGISTGDGEIVAVALSQVGNVGGQPYWSWYGFPSRVEWCACFVSWCANECGYIDAGVAPKFAGCVQGSQWFKERGLWQDRGYEPQPGDLVFFDWACFVP